MKLRYPNITATSTYDQLRQLRGYLYTLVDALNAADAQTAPAPVQNTAAPSSPEKDFGTLKALIIKSADIVEAYTEKIGKTLSGSYVARSDYGDFVERTENAITANATAIEQSYSHLQQLVTDLQTQSLQTRGYIRTGLLYYAGAEDSLPEGTPVYGVEVGQQTQDSFACFGRFTAYGMTFFDGQGQPVAQVARGQLQIPHAAVSQSLTLGGFYQEAQADGSLVTRWVGV